MPKKIETMDEKHRAFCREYIKHRVGSDAVIAAGYKTKHPRITACRLLARPYIQDEIRRLRGEIDQKVSISVEWVIQRLVENAKGAAAIRDYSASNGALKLLGEYLEMFSDKPGINVQMNAIITGDARKELMDMMLRARQEKRALPFGNGNNQGS